MEIILTARVENLGNLGDIVKVRSGYARNYLLPYGKAQLVTEENLKALEARKAEIEEQLRKELEAAQAVADQINGKEIEIVMDNVNAEGRLPGGIGTTDIVNLMQSTHAIEVARSQIRLPDGSFHFIGSYQVEIHVHPDVNATITLNIKDANPDNKVAIAEPAAETDAEAAAADAAQVNEVPEAAQEDGSSSSV